jgi:hypothetical protein
VGPESRAAAEGPEVEDVEETEEAEDPPPLLKKLAASPRQMGHVRLV